LVLRVGRSRYSVLLRQLPEAKQLGDIADLLYTGRRRSIVLVLVGRHLTSATTTKQKRTTHIIRLKVPLSPLLQLLPVWWLVCIDAPAPIIRFFRYLCAVRRSVGVGYWWREGESPLEFVIGWLAKWDRMERWVGHFRCQNVLKREWEIGIEVGIAKVEEGKEGIVYIGWEGNAFLIKIWW
jgi:hypothetical protein